MKHHTVFSSTEENTMTSAAARAGTLAGYDDISDLRQARDIDWVLDWLPASTGRIADLGCGTGALLAAALRRRPEITLAVGVDRETSRLEAARAKLAGLAGSAEIRLVAADLRRPPEGGDLSPAAPFDAGRPFDAVTLTSVLHWIYPDEARLLGWVAARLAPGGAFLLTTHHPERDADGLGGSDELARDALAECGVEEARLPGRLRAAGIVPIATRSRTVDDLLTLLDEHFRVEASDEREAVVQAESGEHYQRFHAATFGTYYSRLLGPDGAERYFAALGRVAQRRLEERGYVTRMPVRRWRCAPRA